MARTAFANNAMFLKHQIGDKVSTADTISMFEVGGYDSGCLQPIFAERRFAEVGTLHTD